MMESNPLAKLKDHKSDYVFDKCGLNMMEIWESKKFGGPVFSNFTKKDGTKMSNNLRAKVLDLRIEYLYGGGYYKFENLPDPENNQIIDLYIIMEDVKKFEDMQYLKELFSKDDSTKRSSAPVDNRKKINQLEQGEEGSRKSSERRANKKKSAKEITFSDIKESITGCARIIKY